MDAKTKDIADVTRHEILHILTSLALHAGKGGDKPEDVDTIGFGVCGGSSEGDVEGEAFIQCLDPAIMMTVLIEQAANGGSLEGTCVSDEDVAKMMSCFTAAQTDPAKAADVVIAMAVSKWLAHHDVRSKIGTLPDNFRRFMADVSVDEIWDAVAEGAKAVGTIAGRMPDDEMLKVFDAFPLPDVVAKPAVLPTVPPPDWPRLSIGEAFKQQALEAQPMETAQ